MKSKIKSLLLIAFLSTSMSAFAIGGNQDSTSIGQFLNQGATTPIMNQSQQRSIINNNGISAIGVLNRTCQSTVLTWTSNGNTCSGNTAQTSQGITRTIISNSANSGSATYSCNNGQWVSPKNLSCIKPAAINACPVGSTSIAECPAGTKFVVKGQIGTTIVGECE